MYVCCHMVCNTPRTDMHSSCESTLFEHSKVMVHQTHLVHNVNIELEFYSIQYTGDRCTLIAVVLMYVKYAHNLLYLKVCVHIYSHNIPIKTVCDCCYQGMSFEGKFQMMSILLLVHYNLLYNDIYIQVYRSQFDICIIEIS